jgi:hypoxanthine phosphoribosyltransferase
VTDSSGLLDNDPAVGEVLVSQEQIAARVAELGAEITQEYQGKAPLLVGVLKGAVLFASDLCRAVNLPVEIDFMAVSSYGSSTRTSGVVRILKDLDVDVAGRDVILIEDIVDSGLTLSYLRRTLSARKPASLQICSLLVRDDQTDLDDLVRYVGFKVPPGWVVGYGLDVAQRYRNLPDIRSYDSDAAS